MSKRKPKLELELTWIGKENRPKLEPRILLEWQCIGYMKLMKISVQLMHCFKRWFK